MRALISWLARIGADPGPRRSTRLAERLRSYPSWHVPHLGTNGAYPNSPASLLSEAEFRANLHAYLAAMPKRTETLRALLTEFGHDLRDAYDEDRRDPFIRSLHLTLLAELPATYEERLSDFHCWEASDRAGDAIVYSLLGDLAMLFADVLLKAKPGCFVGMDLDPENRDMVSYGRPCVLGLSDGLFPGTHELFDYENEMAGVYRRMKRPEISFVDAEHVAGSYSHRLIGNTVLETCQRSVVEPDLPERRARGWMARAV